MISWLGKWDARAVGGLDIWEFSARSLAHAYGRFFFQQMTLRHPWRTWNGLQVYARTVRPARQPGLAPVLVKNEEDFCGRAAMGPWLLALGFCEKPITPPCPADRFNHDCSWLQQHALLDQATPVPVPCHGCRFRELAERALAAGASLHFMTSAQDIAQDILLPSLRHQKWMGLLLCVCPFSVPPISLAMTLCQLPGLVLSYSSGDCQDYHAWLRADVGIKPERTFVASSVHQRMIALLDNIATKRSRLGVSGNERFRAQDHFFHPQPSLPASGQTVNLKASCQGICPE